ncbi:MAG TPA: histidine kinase dimerization/phospho-acceptor domain-containing protein [Myxococcota bacterium]|nr:histidine kinase dimerization/phospho-acceptor domain-containing protein [Myxococcota bacterium]
MPCVGELPSSATLRLLEAMDERVVVLRLEDRSDPRSLRFIWANYEWDPYNELAIEAIIGKRLVDVFPDVAGTAILDAYVGALQSQTAIGLPEMSLGDSRFPEHVYQIQAVPLSEDVVASVVRSRTAQRRAQAALQLLNRDLELRIVEATADVRAANQELESFSYSVSHDLRAPLRAMTGFSQYLVETYGDSFEGEARYLLGRIQSGAVRMSELIDALLQLSRLTRQSLERQPVDVVVLSREILADPTLTRALLTNLLGNSWKFCRQRRVTRIGLAIVDRIVKRHGGRISARGQPNKGAAFTLSLEARPE